MVLSFANERTLGIAETVCASGMLFSGLVLGIRGIKGHYVRTLGLSLAMAGIFMIGFGSSENIILIGVSGFLFFAMLPFANNSLDYLIRTNIPDNVQGRAWGMIGFLSQLGYVVAYAISGVTADLLGKTTGYGVGRGSGLLIMAAGIFQMAVAVMIWIPKHVKELEMKKEIVYE
nr:MFS transporter [Lachnospiraceae bacterium]